MFGSDCSYFPSYISLLPTCPTSGGGKVLEWDKKNASEDVRVKVKVKGSADMGWATRAAADGTQFMKIQ